MGIAPNTTRALGRPERAVAGKSPTALAHSAGYEADVLDPILDSQIAVCAKTVRQAELLGKKVEEALRKLDEVALQGGANALQDANAVTMLFERMSKAGLNVVKAVDELSRLRSFMAGGPDSRPELTGKSEIELRALIVGLLPQLGLKVVDISTENPV